MQLNGVPALVTGGGSGLGAATAAALANAGAKIAVLDVNLATAEAVASRLGGTAHRCDVADAASAEHAVTEAAGAHGPARILVNCAGIAPAGRIVGRDGPMALDAFRRVVEINLIGTFNMLRLAAAGMAGLAPMEDGERGVVVNTASIAAYDGQVGQSAYAASKGGVVSLTLAAARDLSRHGIRVMTVAPGIFRTPMLEALPQEVQTSLGVAVPFPPRLGEPDEYAALVLHICGNRLLNGETIRLDGALRMAPR